MKKLNRGLKIGIFLCLLVSIPVVLSFFWLPYEANAMNYEAVFAKPSLKHLFGTDNFGRDIFCRVAEGTMATFLIALFTSCVGALIGGIVGALTGYFGGVVDEILMRVNDGLASFPSVLLALVVVSILDKGTLNICIALSIVFIPSFARIMRSEFMAQRSRDYVANAKLMGAGHLRIMFVHILPNTLPVLGSSMLVGINNAVLAEAGLSYLGLGVQPPDPSLGRMLSEAQVYIFGAPWYVTFASLTMIAAILGLSLVSTNLGVSPLNFNKIKKEIEQRRLAELADRKYPIGENKPGTEGQSVETFKSDAENSKNVPCLEIKNLHVGFIGENGVREVIKGIDFDLAEGEILGIVGESGSGKSMTALSIMGIAPAESAIVSGDILYRGRSIAGLDDKAMSDIRGKEIAMIFQEPMTSLNPVQTIGEQLDEMLDLHASYLTPGEQRTRVLEALSDTGLKEVEKLYNMYPHELSGGMRQRVMIAMALVAGAKVVLADEPTTALDADIAGVILDIFREINKKYGTSVILISHDLEVIARICNRAIVVKDGTIVEELDIYEEESNNAGSVSFEEPKTDYAQRLLRAAFADTSYIGSRNECLETIVELRKFSVFYKNRGKGVFCGKNLKQVNFDVDMDIGRGECVGIVGPSGCGKTTLVKAIAGLQKYVAGEMKLKCDKPGMVFQDPLSSLNPAMRVGRLLEEPLRIGGRAKDKERAKELVAAALKSVELDETLVSRKVSQLSGGQRQRISIALNIILNRELIILDEPVSALDVTIREQVLELLMRLKGERGWTFIIISHDRRLVSRICDTVYSAEDGHVVKIR